MLLTEFREWTMWLMEAGILFYVGIEYHYDKAKDEEKKQRRTKTTKKTTKSADGASVVEEQTEEVIGGPRRVDGGGADNICGACGDPDPFQRHAHG